MLRLYLDSDVHGGLLTALRTAYAVALDVIASWEVPGNADLPDEAQLSYASSQGRVLYTNDTDFVELSGDWFLAGRHHTGIILCYPRHQPDVGYQLARPRTLLGRETPESVADSLVQLESYLPSHR